MESAMFCDLCRNTFSDLKECPNCVGEPLLDLNDPEVRSFLEDQDHKDRRKRLTQLTFGAMVIASPLLALLLYLRIHIVIDLIAYGFSVVAITKILEKAFGKPPRFPK